MSGTARDDRRPGAYCPVHATWRELAGAVESGRFTDPWDRQRVIEMRDLVRDVASGRAGADYLTALSGLADHLSREGRGDAARETGRLTGERLAADAEMFESHVRTHNCAAGACAALTPAPCQMACPAGIDIPSYVTLIGQGMDAEAIELIRKDNPFPWVCGLVCTNPCEFMCVRARMDEPVSIKFLKGFAAERAMSEHRYRNPEAAPPNGRKVAVIGAGPAGLTAAYYLALKGYGVTIIEGLPMAGGMMMVGIPRYRLPREVIDREVALIEELGVEFRFNTYLGQDVTVDDLRDEGFEAMLVAMGAHSCMRLKIPGETTLRPVLSAVDLLRETALGERHLPGRRAAIIGGGNVAIDAARTLLRLGAEEVTVVYRRTRSEMPANPEEVHQAEEEGVRFSFLTMPVAVAGRDGRVRGLTCLRTELGPPDEGGRRRPEPVEGSEHTLDVDVVVSAIGQAIHPGGLTVIKDMKWSRRGTIVVDPASMRTTSDGVFAAGDIVSGPATVIEAIGGGRRAADAMDRYLSGLPQPQAPPIPTRRARLDFLEVTAATKMILKRPEQDLINLDRRRVTFQQVELGYTENEVREEARRCLRCDVCIRCGACVTTCRDKMRVNALHLGHLDFDHPGPTDFRVTAERCITCGACALACPTGAMVMTDRGDERLLAMCGTILNRQKLLRCRECGAALGPARYQDFIRGRINLTAEAAPGLCMDCARRAAGRQHADSAPPAGPTAGGEGS